MNSAVPGAEVWTKAWDAYLETLGRSVEGSLTSPEFLRLQRRTLDMLCGHRDLWLKAMSELTPKAAARKHLAGRKPRRAGLQRG